MERVYLDRQCLHFRKRPNHQYFSLKDEKAVIQASVWLVYRSFGFELEEGIEDQRHRKCIQLHLSHGKVIPSSLKRLSQISSLANSI